MIACTHTFTTATRGQGTYEITDEVARLVRESGIETGTVTVFVQHTSASLVIYENADPSARTDLHAFFRRLCPEEEDYFTHTAEGPDDMPSHLRMVLDGANRRSGQTPTTDTTMERRCGARRCSKRNMPCHVPSANRPWAMGTDSLDRVKTMRRCEVVSSLPSAVWT